MTPFDYSPFLQRWSEKFDPDRSFLESDGARAPTIKAMQVIWGSLTDLDTANFERQARLERNRQQAGLIYRLLAGIDSFEDTVQITTSLGELALQASLSHHQRILGDTFGVPADPRFTVIGLGKLGGRELNLSSDIDIFCVFGSDGKTAGPRVRDHSDFFTHLTQRMARSLDTKTLDGLVARVDQRLRPWGSAGRLAIPAFACSEYYESHGREWERFALLKARPVAGNLELGSELLKELKPFMFRKYLDFGVFESIRELKVKIEIEVRRSGKETDVKVGRGGIREAEFIVQSMQLLRGGQVPSLQGTSFLNTLDGLVDQNILPFIEGIQLREDYLWLRNLEHLIQAENDQQTHALPHDLGPLSAVLGFASAHDFELERRNVTDRVNASFTSFLKTEKPEKLAERPVLDEVLNRLDLFQNREACDRLEPVAKKRLLNLIEKLGPALSLYSLDVTDRMLDFISTCMRRSAYFALLSENPETLRRMLDILNRSSWIAERLIEMPALLDELLMLNPVDAVMSREAIRQELNVRMQRVGPDDTERFTETLVQFARGLAFRVAVFEVRGEIPLMKVSDQLTWVAEAVVNEVLAYAHQECISRYGSPQLICGNDSGISVLGYGKLGGIEMSYGSDLDLVFVHGVDSAKLTDGVQPIEGGVFVTRVVRRMVALLEEPTRFGRLYEIDTRLRPSGHSGLMVVAIDAFEKYLDESAWTWELQAFVRARPVAGERLLNDELEALRKSILVRTRDSSALLIDVINMRKKMRSQMLIAPNIDCFDLKQGEGGIVDIEFMVQYHILANARTYPGLALYSDNIRQLEALSLVGCLSDADADALKAAYVRYRSLNHEAILAGRAGLIAAELVRDERRTVNRLWAQWMKYS